MTASCPPDTVLLISDLHLSPERPDLVQAFLRFLAHEARGASALYILGDLFDAWIGDDDDTPLYADIAAALADVSERGIAVYLMHGNRDFLLGPAFASACGATLINEPHLLHYAGHSYVLLHGDALCTADTDYLAFRAMVRDPAWQATFLERSLEERRAFANQARARSKTMSSNKPEDIMDVTPEAVATLAGTHRVPVLIHGHTHRPAVHDLDIDDTAVRRIVLGDWRRDGTWYARLDAQGASLQRLEFTPFGPPGSV